MSELRPLQLALWQGNPVVGDLAGNRERIAEQLTQAEAWGADLLLTPELALTGYPPEDLLLRPGFLAETQRAVANLAARTGTTALVLGTPWPTPAGLVNAALVLRSGHIEAIYAKQKLPNYSVFDEQRYFVPGQSATVVTLAGWRLGLTVCEDIWSAAPAAAAAAAGAQVVLNLNASPYHRGKARQREHVVGQRVIETGCPVVYGNMVGGQDELVFDGRSFLAAPGGLCWPLMPAWQQGLVAVELALAPEPDSDSGWTLTHKQQQRDPGGPVWPPASLHAVTGADGANAPVGRYPPGSLSPPDPPGPPGSLSHLDQLDPFDPINALGPLTPGAPESAGEEIAEDGTEREPFDAEAEDLYQALLWGIHDYVRKNGFNGVLLGLSGGIDSALTAALAADALGPAAVSAVMLPYHYTASISREDARQEAKKLGIAYREIPIAPMVDAFRAGLPDVFADDGKDSSDLTKQNLQSRCRGVALMALSNRTGHLLLATGNKSEMAVGYATLYGDMAGAFAPLRDVSKHWVYRLAAMRNRFGTVIPERVLIRAPSAELAPGQEDQDSLPPYAELDAILEAFIEREATVAEIVAQGFDPGTVARVARLVFAAEFKRRQAPPGIRVTPRAFGRDRRYPITSGYRESAP